MNGVKKEALLEAAMDIQSRIAGIIDTLEKDADSPKFDQWAEAVDAVKKGNIRTFMREGIMIMREDEYSKRIADAIHHAMRG